MLVTVLAVPLTGLLLLLLMHRVEQRLDTTPQTPRLREGGFGIAALQWLPVSTEAERLSSPAVRDIRLRIGDSSRTDARVTEEREAASHEWAAKPFLL